MEDHFRFARYPGVIHVAEGTFLARGTKKLFSQPMCSMKELLLYWRLLSMSNGCRRP